MKGLRWVAAVVALVACGNSADPVSPAGAGAGGGGAAGAGSGAGTAGGAAGVDAFACEKDAPAVSGPMLHAAAFEVLTAMGPPGPSGVVGACNFSSCHIAPRGKAMLVLNGMPNLTALVGKPSCEVPALSLVEPGGGDNALEKSFLWIKLVGESDRDGTLLAQPGWGAGGVTSCGDITATTPFGMRMPRSAAPITDGRLTAIRRWICGGAPSP